MTDMLPAGTEIDLTNCDREPIHLSGAIQPYGVLLAVDNPDFVVRQVSANSAVLLGTEAAALLGAPLSRALGDAAVAVLRQAVLETRGSRSVPLFIDAPSGQRLSLTWHRCGALIVVELVPTVRPDQATIARLFDGMTRAIRELNDASSVDQLCATAAAEVRQLAGSDRVMVYRFHPDWHGEVVAEERGPGLEPFLGLHYPASDIPVQARALYLLNHLRVIGDVGYTPVPLLGAAGEEPLDLSLSGLRSVSPVHLEYLRNMGVRATLTMSLMHRGRLWGMIACHHDTPRLISAQVHTSCGVLAQAIGMRIIAQEDEEESANRARLTADRVTVLTRMGEAESLALGLSDAVPSAASLTAADGMYACIDGRTVTSGAVPPEHAVQALLAVLRAQTAPSELVCDDLPSRVREMHDFAEQAAGVLAMPISADYEDFILWFRGEWRHTVTWAGDPDKPMEAAPASALDPGLIRLRPRGSFQAWTQEVFERCRPWSGAEIDSARALARAVPDLQLARARLHVTQLSNLTQRETEAHLTVAAALRDNEERLRDNEERLRQLAVDAAVGLFVCSADPAGFVRVHVNATLRTLLELDPTADVRLPDLLRAVHPDDRPNAEAVLQPGEAHIATWADVRLTPRDGTIRWVRLTSDPTVATDRRADGVSGTVEDVTAYKSGEEAVVAARREAERAIASKNEFLSRMSHELRTPLNAVLGFGQLLELGELTASQKQAVGHILGGGRHLLAMIDDVLDINDSAAARLSLAPEPVLVGEAISASIAAIGPAAASAGIEIGYDPALPGGAAFVRADRVRLQQVLANLLSNAVKFNRPQGRVDVTATILGNVVAIGVTDTGIGIPADDLSRLFEPFDRLGRQALNIPGTGIGLLLTQRLTTLMGGQVEVESTAGQGSTFTVMLPLVAETRTTEAF